MEYLKLKNSELVVSRFCMGGCPMGGYGWGSVQKDELLEAIRCALDEGVNFFDTADTYGLGESEKTLAEGLGNDRNNVIIQTKFGVRIENGYTFYDNSPNYIEHALNESLKRLKRDYVDILTIHYRDSSTPLDSVIEKLTDLKKIGKIRYFGLSNLTHEDIDELLPKKGLFVDCQNEYSLACRKNEGVLLRAEKELKVTPLTWGSLGQGILTGKYSRANINFEANDRRSRDIYVNFHGEKLKKNLEIVEILKTVALNNNKSVASCAIRFILDKIPDSVVIAGVKRKGQLQANIESMGWSLTSNEIGVLDEISK